MAARLTLAEKYGRCVPRAPDEELTAFEKAMCDSSEAAVRFIMRQRNRAFPEMCGVMRLAKVRTGLTGDTVPEIATLSKLMGVNTQTVRAMSFGLCPSDFDVFVNVLHVAGLKMAHAVVIWARCQLPRELDEYRRFIGMNLEYSSTGAHKTLAKFAVDETTKDDPGTRDYFERTYMGYRSRSKPDEAWEKWEQETEAYCAARGIEPKAASVRYRDAKGKIHLLKRGVSKRSLVKGGEAKFRRETQKREAEQVDWPDNADEGEWPPRDASTPREVRRKWRVPK